MNFSVQDNNIHVDDQVIPLYSREGFEFMSDVWNKVGWNQKYSYTFTWMGRPIIQIPEDMVRMQEMLFRVQPDLLIETGVAHGGSLVFYASLMQAMDRGHVLGIDIRIHAPNRAAIESHPMAHRISLVEGDSTAPDTLAAARRAIAPGAKTMVVLDSNHTREHVLREILAYRDMVSVGSYLVVTDGYMESLHDVPRGEASWKNDNPCEAVREFLRGTTDFVLEEPQWLFNESPLRKPITYWPNAWLRRVR